MNSRRMIPVLRWTLSLAVLALIVAVYIRWLHVNPTTVALTLVLYVLVVASQLGLRYAITVSVIATAAYNYYFLPPVRTFTIADPQNWLALLTFLSTSIIGSRLSETARDEAAAARSRQREMELLYNMSRGFLQLETVTEAAQAIPSLINSSATAASVVLYLLDGDRLYRAGLRDVGSVEVPHFRQRALTLTNPEILSGHEVHIPLRTGVRPRGLLVLYGAQLAPESAGAIGGLVSFALDRAQAIEETARTEANKESERLRTLILDSITHELRTPLTSIKGAASALRSGDSMTASDRNELVSIVDEEADRLNRLVGQAVEMAQIEAREVQMHIAPIRLVDLFDAARADCAWIENTHTLHVALPEDIHVLADPEMMGKVICNLLENAAKYSPDGTPIFVSAHIAAPLLELSVADHGIGIESGEQSLIFDRLYRSRTQMEKTSGTGMGLAISRAIVESHSGELRVTSQPGHGSVFTFTLRIASDPEL